MKITELFEAETIETSNPSFLEQLDIVMEQLYKLEKNTDDDPILVPRRKRAIDRLKTQFFIMELNLPMYCSEILKHNQNCLNAWDAIEGFRKICINVHECCKKYNGFPQTFQASFTIDQIAHSTVKTSWFKDMDVIIPISNGAFRYWTVESTNKWLADVIREEWDSDFNEEQHGSPEDFFSTPEVGKRFEKFIACVLQHPDYECIEWQDRDEAGTIYKLALIKR